MEYMNKVLENLTIVIGAFLTALALKEEIGLILGTILIMIGIFITPIGKSLIEKEEQKEWQ